MPAPITHHAGPEALAQDIARRLQQAITDRGRAVLSVSGGRSPVVLFEALRTQALDWSRVVVTLVDERCVPCTHADSNARLVRLHLLQGQAAAARLVPLVPHDHGPLPAPVALALAADQSLREQGPADVLVLGMGADGHTASLFPGTAVLDDALDPACTRTCLPVELAPPPAHAPHPRLTQTLAHMLRSGHIVLPLSGADKLATLAHARRGRDKALPISYLLHQDRAPLALWITP